MKTIGVLSLQGDFEAHSAALKKCGARPVPVRKPSEMQSIDGLILPGGESTTMIKLLIAYDLIDPIRTLHESGKGLFGTCAGSILMASRISGTSQFSFAFMGITIERNGYGRQSDSFESDIRVGGFRPEMYHAVFIRAPRILKYNADVSVLASHDGDPVLVQQGHLLSSTFHPEIGDDTRIHELFLKSCVNG